MTTSDFLFWNLFGILNLLLVIFIPSIYNQPHELNESISDYDCLPQNISGS